MLKVILLTIWICWIVFNVHKKIDAYVHIDWIDFWVGVPINIVIWVGFIYWFSL